MDIGRKSVIGNLTIEEARIMFCLDTSELVLAHILILALLHAGLLW